MNNLKPCKPVSKVRAIEIKVSLEAAVNEDFTLSDVPLSPRSFASLLEQCQK